MKLIAVLCLFTAACLPAVSAVAAGTATVLTGNHIKARVLTLQPQFGTEVTGGTHNIVITSDEPLFEPSLGATTARTFAQCLTTLGTGADGSTPKLATSTCAVNAAGTILTVVAGGDALTANTASRITFQTEVISASAPAGIYNLKVQTTATADGSAVDSMAATVAVPLYSAAETFALGPIAMGTSTLKSVAAGTFTFNFFVQEAQTGGTDTITFTASEAIFAASATASGALIDTLTSDTATSPAAAASNVKGASTVETDSTGKILKLVVATTLPADTLIVLTVTTGAVASANPSTAGLVTYTAVSTATTTAVSSTVPIFNAALTPIYLGATVGTDEISVAPGSLNVMFVPKGATAAGQTMTITSSTAIFTASSTPACALGPNSWTIGQLCQAAADADGKVLTVTTVSVALVAGQKYTISISDNLANNAGTAGAAGTIALQTSVDTTAAATADGAYLFGAALTAYFKSAAVSTLTGLAAPGNMTLQFVPQATVVGGATAGTVIFTANAAVFDASGSYPGSACQGSDCIVCSSAKDNFATTVPCTAAADSTGKVLTVTASTASTTTDSNDFTASEIGQVVLTNHMVNPNATAVTFALTTGVDTASTGAQTGYTTTSVAGAAPSPPGATTTGTYSTATTTVSFSGYTYVAGPAATNFANVVGCAYAKTVSDATASLTSHMCVASSGPTFTYMTGASTTNTASAARRTGTSVAVALKMYHSLISQTAATAAVTAVGTTLTAIQANLNAINTAAGTGFSTAEITATGMTAASWTHSSAAVVVPSMMAMFSALVLVLMQ